MRHADHDLLDAHHGGALDQRGQHRHQRGGALQGETLLADVFYVEELLEGIGGEQPLENPNAIRRLEPRAIAFALHALLQPVAPRLVGDVHVLDAERAAVGLAQRGDQIAQRRRRISRQRLGADRVIEVGFAEPEVREIQQRMGVDVVAERIELSDQVPELAVRADQRECAAGGLAARGGPAAPLRGQVEPGEEDRPIRGHGVGIDLEARVHVLDVRRIGTLDRIQPVGHRAPRTNGPRCRVATRVYKVQTLFGGRDYHGWAGRRSVRARECGFTRLARHFRGPERSS